MRSLAVIAILFATMPGAAVAGEKKAKEAKTCRQTPAINSRLPGRMLCRTAREWAREDFYLQRGSAWLEGRAINHPDAGAMPGLGR